MIPVLGHREYLALMVGCLLVTLPLELVLGARVYRRPRQLALAVLPVAAVFVVWDLIAIRREHWWFDPASTTGLVLPGGLPLEELVFLVAIPICAVLTYEAVGIGLAWIRTRRAVPRATTPTQVGSAEDA